MRILVVTIDYLPNVSGIATLSYEQARGLAALGHEVHVLVPSRGDFSTNATQCVTLHSFQSSLPPVLRLVSFCRIVRRTVKKVRPDYIWCTNYRGLAVAVMLAAITMRIPYGLFLHGTELITESKNVLRKWLLSATIRKAHLVATNSNYVSGILEALYRKRGEVLTPGVHPLPIGLSSVRDKAHKYRQAWLASVPSEIPDQQRLVYLSSSRISRQKGLHLFIRSLAEIDPSLRQRILYVIGGTGPDEHTLRKLVNDLDLQGHVHFAGMAERSDLPAVLHAADFFIQPSQPEGDFIEGFGISLLEAQSVGTPCIATNWCGIPEAVIPNHTSLLVEIHSLRAIADAIVLSANSPAWRASASESAIEWASTNTWEKHVDKLDKLIRSGESRMFDR